jgi:ribose transport system ATP-binding protein
VVTPSEESMVELRDVTIGHGIGPLTCQVKRGEIFGIFSLPGQGQRELLLALAGDQKFSGSIEIDGKPYAPGSPADSASWGVFLVPEDRAVEGLFHGHSTQMNVTISAIENVAEVSLLIDKRKEKRVARRGAEEVGLAPDRLPHLISTLSGGNQQKAIFARAVLERPKVLILFDSTRGVDVGTKAEIYRLVMSFVEEGMTVVFYSSDISETTHFCDRVAVMSGGRIVDIVSREHATEGELLRLALGGSTRASPKGAVES